MLGGANSVSIGSMEPLADVGRQGILASHVGQLAQLGGALLPQDRELGRTIGGDLGVDCVPGGVTRTLLVEQGECFVVTALERVKMGQRQVDLGPTRVAKPACLELGPQGRYQGAPRRERGDVYVEPGEQR